MALAGDFFRTRMIIEVKGVATQLSNDWKIDSVDGGDSIADILDDIATDFWDRVKGFLTNECTFACMLYYNWSRPEQHVVYPGLTGLAAGSSHPQFQVLRINRYSQVEADLTAPVHRTSQSISGVAESLSTRGRVNDLAEFGTWRTWNLTVKQSSVTGWTFSPYNRFESAPGPPKVFSFDRMLSVSINPTFLTLRSRKTKFCA